MKKATDLKYFSKCVIAFLGSGYVNYKIVTIPKKKSNLKKKEQIIKKLETLYNTNLTRSQRAYAKTKGKANFNAVAYNDIVLIFHTQGLISLDIDLGKGWLIFDEKNSLKARISEHTQILFYKDERKKLTMRLSKENFKDLKNYINECFKTKNGYKFHELIKRLGGLPKYRGIQLQKKELIFYINELKKETGIKWSTPKYI